MLQQFLMPSTNSPASFSTGVFESSFTQPWNLNTSDAALQQTWGPGLLYGASCPIFVGQERVPGAELYYTILFHPGMSNLPEPLSDLVGRVDCLRMISALPADALEEANEALSDISRFHMMRRETADLQCLPLLSSTEVKTMNAKVGRIYDREDFYVSEE